MNRTLAGFIKKELLQALRDPRMRITLFVTPVIQVMLFGYALNTEVRNIRLAASFSPNDTLAQKVVNRAYASGWFLPASVSGDDTVRWIESGQAEAIFIAPPKGFTRAVGREQGEAQLLIDSTNMLRAQSVEKYFKAILLEVWREADGVPPHARGFHFSVRVLYNPALESAIFLVPSVICLVLCVSTIIMTAMSMSRERELGTFEMLIASPVRTWEIIAGKTLPFILLGMVDVPLVLGIALFVFHVPLVGHLWQLFSASLVFVCTTVSIGTLISTFAKNQQQALMGGFMFMMPAILLSGINFPLDNMAEGVRWITYFNPLRYFIVLLRVIMLKGGDPAAFWPNLGALALLGSVTAFWTIRRFRQTLN